MRVKELKSVKFNSTVKLPKAKISRSERAVEFDESPVDQLYRRLVTNNFIIHLMDIYSTSSFFIRFAYIHVNQLLANVTCNVKNR